MVMPGLESDNGELRQYRIQQDGQRSHGAGIASFRKRTYRSEKDQVGMGPRKLSGVIPLENLPGNYADRDVRSGRLSGKSE